MEMHRNFDRSTKWPLQVGWVPKTSSVNLSRNLQLRLPLLHWDEEINYMGQLLAGQCMLLVCMGTPFLEHGTIDQNFNQANRTNGRDCTWTAFLVHCTYLPNIHIPAGGSGTCTWTIIRECGVNISSHKVPEIRFTLIALDSKRIKCLRHIKLSRIKPTCTWCRCQGNV